MVLIINEFTKMYDKKPVIENINVTIDDPMIVGLIGDNGAGKTTLLKCIAGFIRNYQGDIKLNKSIISSIESPAFFENLTVEQNLKFIEKLMMQKSSVSIPQALKFVGLDNQEHKKFRALSLGMKQKLIIARMMLSNSDLYLLDEPFNSLDVKTKKELKTILQELRKQGKTLIISSHILDELSELSDTVWYLKSGQLIQNIDLHTMQRKYNIRIKEKIDNEIITDQQLEKMSKELNMQLAKVDQANETILLRTVISKNDIFSNLNKLITKKIEVLEYYDVTNKLDDYMMHDEREGEHDEDLSS